jgi:hypothetical protein
MDSTSLLIAGLIGIIAQCAIVYYCVRGAVSDALRKHNIAIIKLLALNAQKNGADPNMVDQIVLNSDPAFKHDVHFRKPAAE